MQTVGGIPLDELKKLVFSDTDIVFMLDIATTYTGVVSKGVVLPQSPASVVEMATNTFAQGMIVGIAKARGLTEVTKNWTLT